MHSSLLTLTAAPAATTPWLAIVATVVVFAVVQSLFGVGLLVFGTPTLLLLGLPFELVLLYLLPCSITLSSLQVATSGGLSLEPLRKDFLRFTAPAVLVGTAVALLYGAPGALRVIVGVMLLATAVLRMLASSQSAMATLIRSRQRPLLLLLGVVHGLSNLGGGILTVIVGSSFDDKVQIRRHVAFCYGLMAILQLTVLFLTGVPPGAGAWWLLLPLLAGGIHTVVGQPLFRSAGQRPFQLGLTGLIGVFGVVLLLT